MKSFAFLLAALGATIPQAASLTLAPRLQEQCLHPVANTCTFYPDCLEAKVHCGAAGYPIGYGLKYCEAFTKARPTLSAAGKAWVTKTMLCLQDDMVPYATGTKKAANCAALQKAAFATHPSCYVDSGVCKLPPSDWIIIVKTVSPKTLLGSWDAVLQTLKTVEGCTDFYTWLVKNEIVKVVKAAEDGVKDIWHDVTAWF